jgi:hypothetical protein
MTPRPSSKPGSIFPPRSLAALALLAASLLLGGACDSPSHENLDKWMRTKKGPDKLRAALSESEDPDLAAHAATNLLRKRLDSDVIARLEKLPEARRAAVIEKLVPRLWDMARIEGPELTVPNGDQVMAKDLLVDVRRLAQGAERIRVDGYLLDWYTGGFYDARATPGRHPGSEVVRLIGAPAGERLIPIADSILAKSLVGAQRLKLSDELLLAIAAAGSPATVKYLLELTSMAREGGDKTQGKRAISALYRAYVDPGGLFPVADPTALVPHVQTLIGFAKSDQEGRVVNDAIALVRATGKPTCIEPLVAVTAYPHAQFSYRYIGASAALRCGGADAIAPVIAALPEGASYSRDALGGAVWRVISKLDDRPAVLAALRALGKGESKLGRWVAVEALAAMGSAEDLPLLEAISSDRRKLTGYWGNQEDVPAKDRKAEPTLGARAAELAAELKAGKGS